MCAWNLVGFPQREGERIPIAWFQVDRAARALTRQVPTRGGIPRIPESAGVHTSVDQRNRPMVDVIAQLRLNAPPVRFATITVGERQAAASPSANHRYEHRCLCTTTRRDSSSRSTNEATTRIVFRSIAQYEWRT